MAYRIDQNSGDLIIDGFETGIASSPYQGIANIRNLNTSYYPGVAYVNYRRKAATIVGTNVIDTYSETNFSASYNLYSGGTQEYVGQPFYNNSADNLASLKFYCSKTGSPTGNVTASIYAAVINSSGQYVPTNNNFTVSTLVVGGGGGGATTSGGTNQGGGGGGGQVKTSSSIGVVSQAYTITIGGGDVPGGTGGGTSSFGALLSAVGGSSVGDSSTGANSGSGKTGGTISGTDAGGGGGDSANGNNGTGTGTGGAGGAGTASSISGSSVTYGGGGGGGSNGTGGAGGAGGGGAGGSNSNGSNATANTGGGGGGSGHNGDTGGNGGSGIVIISYPTGSLTATSTGTRTTSGGNTIDTFTSSGTWTVTSAPSALATSNNVLASSLTGSNVLTTFTFASPPSLSAKTYYIATVQYTGGDSSDYVSVGYGITSEYINNVSLYSATGSIFIVQSSPAITNLIYYAISSSSATMTNPVQQAQSPAGLNYILDDSGQIWKQSAVNSSTFNLLANGPGRLGNGSGGLAYFQNYLVVFGDGLIEFCGNGTNDSGITSQNWNLNSLLLTEGTVNQNLSAFIVTTISPPTTSIAATAFAVTAGQQIIFYTTGTLPAPIVAGTVYYATSTASSGSSFTISSTPGGSSITFTSAGSTAAGTVFLSILPMSVPNGNVSNFQFTTQIVPGSTSGTISSYTLPNGTTANGMWLLATGNYNIIDQRGFTYQAAFTNNSATVTFIQPANTVNYINHVNLTVQILDTSATSYRAYVSKSDGNLYFCNGARIGRIYFNPAVYSTFDPSNPSSYLLRYDAVSPTISGDVIVDMVDLSGNLLFGGERDIYLWDFINVQPSATRPVGEQIVRMINLLNNAYVLAGQKGSVYFTNGYSVQLLTKIPDFVAGSIDPVWLWGDMMVRRSRLYFQAIAQNTSGTNLLAGIFSLQVSPSVLGETSSGLIMDAQNSYGLTPSAGALMNGVLIDNPSSANGQDSYYSAWSNGASTGGIDYNDTTEWQNNEPTIESDIIPIGTILQKSTFGNIEFKLDRPMASGDSITLYWRPSLTDSYTTIGTTTTSVLSDYKPSNITLAQWAQFKVTLSCASSNSSRIPLREIRIHPK